MFEEYLTSSYDEYTYLRMNKIFCVSVSTEDGLSIYHYKKTPELFAALSHLYDEVRSREEYSRLKNLFSDPAQQVYSYDTFTEALNAAADIQKEQGRAMIE